MSRRNGTRIPTYRKHKASGQARVTLGGRTFYLGRFGTKRSKVEYDRRVAEWTASGCPRNWISSTGQTSQSRTCSVGQLTLAYWDYTKTHYTKNGRPTAEAGLIQQAVRHVTRFYSALPVEEFGPLKLKACRQSMVDSGLTRGVVNHHVGRVRRMYKWGVENELVTPGTLHALQAVAGLRMGKTQAPDLEPVRPVPEEYIGPVLDRVSRQVAAMIQVQLLTGMRPGEVLQMRTRDLDLTDDVWTYTPESHKTEYLGRALVKFIGPEAQEVLRPFLRAPGSAYLFQPVEAEASRNQERRMKRETHMTPSQAKRKPNRNRKRAPRDHYTSDTYRRAIARACEEAKIPTWTPHRLRHSAGTKFDKKYGIEKTRILLGHSTAATTEIYVERDREIAKQIMREIG